MAPWGPWPGTPATQNLPFAWFEQDVSTDGNLVVSTTPPTFTAVQTLGPLSYVAGLYRFDWYCETFQSATSNSVEVQFLVDGFVDGDTRHGDEVDVVDVHEHTGFFTVNLGAGAHTAVLQGAVTAGTATFRRRRIMVTRIG